MDEDMYHSTEAPILKHEELPPITICMPTWNRRRFIPLILLNINAMDYPKKKIELCIMDDHPTNPLFSNKQEVSQFQIAIYPVKLNYKYDPSRHLTIGEKRNKLVKMASNKICANMDDDDIYMPSYLRYGVSILKNYKVGIVGSPQMLFVYPNADYMLTAINCPSKRQNHEATHIYTKKHFNSMRGYAKNSQGEGAKMIDYNEKNCRCLDVRMCMICVCHDSNTIDKEDFKTTGQEIPNYEMDDLFKKILSGILSTDK